MKNHQDITCQAEVFGSYLLGQPPSAAATKLYVQAMTANPGNQSARDIKLLAFVARHRWSLGFIDAGLAFVRPGAEVRRRLYVMFAILECMPEYHKLFLPQARSRWYLFVVMRAGLKGVINALIGSLFIKVLGW
jgi:hypothetical protein